MRSARLPIFACLVALIVAAPASSANAQDTEAASGTGSVLNLSTGDAVAFVAVAMGLLVLIWFALTFYDRYSMNRWRNKEYMPLVRQLAERAAPGQLSVKDFEALADAAGRPPRGATGLTRTILAVGLLTLIGLALIVLLAGNSSAAGDPLKNLIAALTAAFTTILGFYFGAKTSDDAAERASGAAAADKAAADKAAADKPATGAT